MAEKENKPIEKPEQANEKKPATVVIPEPLSMFEQALEALDLSAHEVQTYRHEGGLIHVRTYTGSERTVALGKLHDPFVEAAIRKAGIDRKAVKAVDRNPKRLIIHYQRDGQIHQFEVPLPNGKR